MHHPFYPQSILKLGPTFLCNKMQIDGKFQHRYSTKHYQRGLTSQPKSKWRNCAGPVAILDLPFMQSQWGRT